MFTKACIVHLLLALLIVSGCSGQTKQHQESGLTKDEALAIAQRELSQKKPHKVFLLQDVRRFEQTYLCRLSLRRPNQSVNEMAHILLHIDKDGKILKKKGDRDHIFKDNIPTGGKEIISKDIMTKYLFMYLESQKDECIIVDSHIFFGMGRWCMFAVSRSDKRVICVLDDKSVDWDHY